MISTSRKVRRRETKMLTRERSSSDLGFRLSVKTILSLCLIWGQAEAFQTSLLSAINLQVPSSLQNSNPKPVTSSSGSNLSRRDLSAKQTTVGTLYERLPFGVEQVGARLQQARTSQQQPPTEATRPAVCQVFGGESVAIVEIEESRGDDMSQNTNPIELPISGSIADDEIELRIESETQKYFKIQGKQLRLTRPLNRDAVPRDQNSTSQLSPQITSIYLQISCADKRPQTNGRQHDSDGRPTSTRSATGGSGSGTTVARKNVIIPVLVKVLDLNDNAPKFSSPIYTVQVDELAPINSILVDNIEAIDLDSANNGLIEYTLFSASGNPIRREQTTQRLVQRDRQTVGQDDHTTPGPISSTSAPRPLQTTSTELPADKLDIFTTVASLSSGGGGSSDSVTSASVGEFGSTVSIRPNQNKAPTINLNNEPIINGPMEDGSEEEESDEALLASMNSTETDLEGDSDSTSILSTSRLSRAPASKRRKKRASHSLFARRTAALQSSSAPLDTASTNRNLWTNLMSGTEPIEVTTLSPVLGGGGGNRFSMEAAQAQQSGGDTGPSADESLFALDFAPNTNRPIIRLRGELDYETSRVHYLTIVATDRAPNREDRLSSKASIVIRVMDGDDQGPAFVLEQSGCATGSLPQTTTAGPFGGSNLVSQSSLRGARRRKRVADSSNSGSPDTVLAPGGSARALPKGFKVTEENFDYSDATRAPNSEEIPNESSPIRSSPPVQVSARIIGAGDSTISPLVVENVEASLNSSSSASRSRRIVGMIDNQRDSSAANAKQSQNTGLDYGCLSNLPLSYGGQAEYFSTVMSGDSDYVLKITPQPIKARDRDELNAPIKYSFVNGTPESFGQFFQINPLDASVKQVAPVDRNRISRFVVWVRAQEQTAKKLSSLAKLTIDVVPTDKNPPVLVCNSHSGFVEENSPIGTLVMTGSTSRSPPIKIHVIDGDQQQQQRQRQASIVDDSPRSFYEFDTTSDAFKVNRDGFVYVNRAQLDRDPPSQAVHVFQVTAKQAGLASSKSISAPISLNVTLLDVNDNPPSIANSSLVPLQIRADGKSAARQLTTIRCVDLDEPANSKVRHSIYHVSNNGRDRFRIQPDTGDLEAVGKFSAGEQYSLTLQLVDELGRLAQGILEVSVVPGPNTGGPKFVFGTGEESQSDRAASSPGYHVEINEGAPINSAVLQVRAIDPENDPITYSIIDGNVNGDFHINSRTGTIYVANRLDREEVSGYKLLVQARDSGGLATNRPVTIQILDNNDENPLFQKPQYLFSVPEGSSSVGKIIGTVQALDADSGPNGRVSYSEGSPRQQLAGSSGGPLFAVDERTGDIRLLEPLDYETAKSHSILVTARDSGENPRLTTTSVLVKVLDIQDEEPYFERSFMELRVGENLPNHRLGQVRAIDPDSVSQVVYELKHGDSSLFAVDPQTGSLSTVQGLDYEQATNHTIIIGTSDAQLSQDQLRLATSDGFLSAAGQQELEGKGWPHRSAICRVDILVGDSNDVAPQFASQPMPVRVQDTAQLGTMITRLLAEDHDGSEPNNQVRYKLVAGDDAAQNPPSAGPTESCAQLFMIDPTTGVVSVRSDLKRSSHSECNLMVRATDLGQQPHSLSASVSLTIYIDHVAEISPASMIAFADTSFTVEIDENPPPNSLVKVLSIINKPKLLANYPMSCEIVGGNELAKFYVAENDQRDCELRLSKFPSSATLDYELKQRYSLTIRLNTIGGGGGSSMAGAARGGANLAQVNVNVLDRNDNKPTFNQPARYSRLTQNRFLAAIAVEAPTETQLIQLRAQDLDSPNANGLVTYELLNEGELGGRFKIDPLDGVVRSSRSLEDIPSSLLPLHLRVLARDNPEQAHDLPPLSSTAEVLVNLIEDRHRLALVLRDSISGRVLENREQLLSILQERSGLIAGFERAESLKVQRNGSIESDVTGTDFWFYLIEPGTFRLVQSDDARLRAKLLDSRAQSSLRDVIGQTLAFQDVTIRLPYSIVTGDPTLLGRTFSSHSSRSQLQLSASSFVSSLITVATIIAILSAIVVVYQCGSRSSQRRAAYGGGGAKGQLPPLPGHFLHPYATAAGQQQPGDYSTFNFPKIGPNAFLAGQDNLAFSGSAFSTLPSSGTGAAGKESRQQQQQQQPMPRDHYQAELDRQAAMLGKEYETQMLKMSVLFDDSQSFDEQRQGANGQHLRFSQNPAAQP